MNGDKKDKDKHLGLTIDYELHYKLVYVSEYDGRSMHREVLHLIRQRIAEYERENGQIEVPPPEPPEG